jgi:bla regulator protein BlaR1
MSQFSIRFFICNIFIVFMIGIILIARRIFKKYLSSRMQYHLWFIMLALLTVPFLPIHLIGFMQVFSWLKNLTISSANNVTTSLQGTPTIISTRSTDWINDFSMSVSRETPSVIGFLLFGIWLAGILVMTILVARSSIRLHHLKQSALPLQNQAVRMLYKECLQEMNVKKMIPIYSTAFLKSPVMVGFFAPCIYLPIHLISDYHAADMRYMLLHELQHYKHKDTLANYLMNLTGIVYWFNPLIWYALKEMRSDREVACDTSVLQMLNENDYEAYGNTLINFASKVSLFPFPFASGMGGSMKQMRRRILNIASYKSFSFGKKLQSAIVFIMIALLLFGLAPILSIYAAEESHYQWETKNETITSINLSAYFKGYNGSFVLYDLENNAWEIYNQDYATLRVAPNSTYKIYDALFGLEAGAITPEQSQINWNEETHSFEAWNADQDLNSAMKNSVNWYFQSIDTQIGAKTVKNYIQKIGYGNQDMTGDFPSYWMESSLKISPIEQVKLLEKFYNNNFGFSPENIQAVKDSICLSSSPRGSFYGKTGTGRVNNQDVNGWFIGYIEISGHTYFFSTNIQADTDATGVAASEITLSILSDLGIFL